MPSSNVNVLIIGSNRPNHLRNLLKSAALNKHKSVFIFLDGYNSGEENAQKFIETQQIARDFLRNNLERLYIFPSKLGCYKGVTTAIDWFFENVEEGLIFEDDLMPHPEILPIAQKTLANFRNYSNVGSISFYRAVGMDEDKKLSISRYPSSWGWATWKNRWDQFDHKAHEHLSYRPVLLFRHGGWTGLRRWYHIITRLKNGDLDSWAYRWMFTFWLKKYYTVVCPFNLIENNGFGEDATHTKKGSGNSLYSGKILDTQAWNMTTLLVDEVYDQELLKIQFGIY